MKILTAISVLVAFTTISCDSIKQKPLETIAALTEEESPLKSTKALSGEVKEFLKTLGITPTNALAETAADKPAKSMLYVWCQAQGTIAYRNFLRTCAVIKFAKPRELIPIEEIWLGPAENEKRNSFYFRQSDQFASEQSLITPEFSRDSKARQVETITHENIHGTFSNHVWSTVNEPFTTALGYLTALEFFKQQNDFKNVAGVLTNIIELEKMSRELNEFAAKLEELFSQNRPLDDKRRDARRLVDNYSTYKRWYEWNLTEKKDDKINEALVSHDIAYYRYVDKIFELRRLIGDLKFLIKDLGGIPTTISDSKDVDNYLNMVESRYRNK